MPNHFPLQGSGSGIYTLNVAQELVRLGHEVLVIVPDHQPELPDVNEFPTQTIVFSDGQNEDLAEVDFNFPCFTTHPRSVTTFYELSDEQMAAYIDVWRKHINQAIAEFQPDIIHAHHVWVTPYVASETGLPYVISVHGTDLMGYRDGPRYRELARTAAEKSYGLIAISHQVEDDTISTYGVSKDKVHLIANGFDLDIFKVIPEATKAAVLPEFDIEATDAPMISFVGKFTDFKGIDVLLKAAAIYEQAFPGIQTVLVGHGQLWDDMHNLRDELGLAGVHFLGHQPQPKVARVYNAADVSVVPSRIEPFGLVAVEALACGTPVVATNEGGLPDFINDQVGALVAVGDHQALAQAIINELQANSKQDKGVYAAQYALAGYSWPSQVKKMADLYVAALAGS
jgi:glycosyltransferase involved in cell wall biosynthesis